MVSVWPIARLLVLTFVACGCESILGGIEEATFVPPQDAGTEEESPGLCGDTASSADHCGRCGHSCLGGACSSGKCLPVRVASDQAELGAMSASGDALVWSSATAVRSFAGVVSDIATSPTPLDRIVRAGSQVFGTGASSLYRWDNAAPVLLHTASSGSLTGLAVGAEDVYVGERGAIERVRKDGSVRERWPLPADPSALAIAAGSLYWIDASGVRVQAAIGPADAGGAPLVTAPGARLLSVSSRAAFFSQDVAADASPTRRWWVYPLPAGPLAPLQTSCDGSAPIAADGNSMYCANGASLRRVDLAGESEVAVAPATVTHINVGDTMVFYATASTGEIFRIAK